MKTLFITIFCSLILANVEKILVFNADTLNNFTIKYPNIQSRVILDFKNEKTREIIMDLSTDVPYEVRVCWSAAYPIDFKITQIKDRVKISGSFTEMPFHLKNFQVPIDVSFFYLTK